MQQEHLTSVTTTDADFAHRMDIALVREQALDAGFAEAGVVTLPYPQEARDKERVTEWLDAGRAGTMQYLHRTSEDGQLLRAAARIPFPWVRSVIVCFTSYHCEEPRSTDPAPEDTVWIARYAWSSRKDAKGESRPSDYHKVLLKRMQSLEEKLHTQYGEFQSRCFVDTGPVVERSIATAAGLGWTGKNTCLIHPRLGSYGFLSVLLTSLEILTPPAPLPDRCGSCRRCLDACPTNALTAPYQMDATRCISYLTIEHKGAVSAELAPQMGRQVFGCDICQDVCPWNRKAPISADVELMPRPELVNPTLEWLASLSESEFEQHFNGSPIRRAGYFGLLRNIAIAIGNSKSCADYMKQLTEWADSSDEGLRSAARQALQSLSR